MTDGKIQKKNGHIIHSFSDLAHAKFMAGRISHPEANRDKQTSGDQHQVGISKPEEHGENQSPEIRNCYGE